MASINVEDHSGKPRPREEVEESIRVCSTHLVRSMPPKIPVDLYMQLTTIRECLQELLWYRDKLAEAEKRIAVKSE